MSNIMEEAEPQPLAQIGGRQLPPGVIPTADEIQLAEWMRRESRPHFEMMWTLLMQERVTKLPAENGVVASGSKASKRWQPISYNYHDQLRLYKNDRFVVKVEDMRKKKCDMENIVIWRVRNETRTLRKYVPVKYGKMQFFARSSEQKRFNENEFKSESFFERFQPIVVDVIEEEEYRVLESGKKSKKCIVQFVYIDESFFQRMRQSLGRIYLSDSLRKIFMDGLLVTVLMSLMPEFLDMWDKRLRTFPEETFPKNAVEAWRCISHAIDVQLKFLEDNCGLKQLAWDLLFSYPCFEKSATGGQLGVNEICSACTGYPGRMSAYSVEFGVETSQQWTYDRKTFEPKLLLKDFRPLDSLYWCSECVDKATKIHCLMHFQHNLIQIKRNHVTQDLKAFGEAKLLPIPCDGNDIIMWIHNLDQHWKNKMFLDYQVTVAETETMLFTSS